MTGDALNLIKKRTFLFASASLSVIDSNINVTLPVLICFGFMWDK